MPGDGVCEATAGAGDVAPSRAALQEASALGVADDQRPRWRLDTTAGREASDGSIRVNLEARQVSLFDSSITVAADASAHTRPRRLPPWEATRVCRGTDEPRGCRNAGPGAFGPRRRRPTDLVRRPAKALRWWIQTQLRGLFESTVLRPGHSRRAGESTFVGMDGPALTTTGEGRSVASLLASLRHALPPGFGAGVHRDGTRVERLRHGKRCVVRVDGSDRPSGRRGDHPRLRRRGHSATTARHVATHRRHPCRTTRPVRAGGSDVIGTPRPVGRRRRRCLCLRRRRRREAVGPSGGDPTRHDVRSGDQATATVESTVRRTVVERCCCAGDPVGGWA